ncbi:MAG: hypothetical protein NVS4B8_10540 [Herpetosiphon sp.]
MPIPGSENAAGISGQYDAALPVGASAVRTPDTLPIMLRTGDAAVHAHAGNMNRSTHEFIRWDTRDLVPWSLSLAGRYLRLDYADQAQLLAGVELL